MIEAVKSHAQFPQLEVDPARETIRTVPDAIEQDWLWDVSRLSSSCVEPLADAYLKRLSSYLRPGDLVVSETGTSQIGIASTVLPKGAKAWTQAIYGSIGYAAGAAIGGSIAAKETGKFKRMVLITGEGSLQLTVQAFSILNRHGIVPVVFILNNEG